MKNLFSDSNHSTNIIEHTIKVRVFSRYQRYSNVQNSWNSCLYGAQFQGCEKENKESEPVQYMTCWTISPMEGKKKRKYVYWGVIIWICKVSREAYWDGDGAYRVTKELSG